MSDRCAVCGYPVVLTEEHITIVRHVERLEAGAITVLDAETIAALHMSCAAACKVDRQDPCRCGHSRRTHVAGEACMALGCSCLEFQDPLGVLDEQ